MKNRNPFEEFFNPQPRVDFVRYAFLDVVGFTHNRSVEAQTDIIAKLNEIVGARTFNCDELVCDQGILIPTGDGICIGIVGKSAFDAHIKVALSILALIDSHNRQTSDKMRQFEVRVGINENTDNLIQDINTNRNIAGTGINMASRIMGLADASQILVSATVYDALSTRQAYMGHFRQYEATIKHGNRIRVYQYVAEDKPGLNISEPSCFLPKQSPPHKLTEWEAYYLAHGLSLRRLFVPYGDIGSSEAAGIVLLYFLAQDSVGFSHQTEVSLYNPKLFGQGSIDIKKVFDYYMHIDFLVLTAFANKISKSLEHLWDLFDKKDNVAPLWHFPNKLAAERISEDQPGIAALFKSKWD